MDVSALNTILLFTVGEIENQGHTMIRGEISRLPSANHQSELDFEKRVSTEPAVSVDL